jgi:hypothetical protein
MELVNGKQSGTGCPDHCPNPNVFPREFQLVGIRPPRIEPLGNGYSAIFQIENSLFMTQGRGVVTGRDSFVGFSSPLGTFKMGYFLGPVRRHPVHLRQRADADDLDPRDIGVVGAGVCRAARERRLRRRLRESIRYDTPTMSGLQASFQFASYEGIVQPHSSAISTGVFYNNGPVQLGIAYELHNKIRGTPIEPLSDRAFSVAAAYQFEAVRLGAVYERLNYDATGTTQLKRISTVSAPLPTWARAFCTYSRARGQRHGQRERRHPHRRAHEGREERLDAMGSELHVSALGAYARLRGLREDQERIECRVHLQSQPVPDPVQYVSQRRVRQAGRLPGRNGALLLARHRMSRRTPDTFAKG